MTREKGAAYATDEMKRAGIGFREHTGWAAMVALGGGVAAPVILARNRYELSEGDLPRAVYHAARQLDLENAGRLVQQVGLVARTAAESQLRRTVAELEAAGYEVVGTAVAAPRELPADLSEILGSHPLVHTSLSSFPSGHAANAIAWVALAVALARGLGGLAARAAVLVVAVAVAAAVGLTRVELRAHYLTDVLAGWSLGAAVFALCGVAGLVVARVRHTNLARS